MLRSFGSASRKGSTQVDHGEDEFLEAADVFVALLDDGRRELGFSVPGHINDDGSDLRGKLFLAVAVAAVTGIGVRRLVTVGTEEAGHLGSHGRFDHVLDHRTENGIEVVQAGDLSLKHLPGQFVAVDQHENLLGFRPLVEVYTDFVTGPFRAALLTMDIFSLG